MRLDSGSVLRRIGGRSIIVKEAEESVNMTDVISLNEVATRLWERFGGEDFSAEDMVSWLCGEYEVSPDRAAADVRDLLEKWKEYKLLF